MAIRPPVHHFSAASLSIIDLGVRLNAGLPMTQSGTSLRGWHWLHRAGALGTEALHVQGISCSGFDMPVTASIRFHFIVFDGHAQ